MPKSFAKGGSGSSGITVGTTTSNGTADTLLKTNATGKVADASGLTNTSAGNLTLVQGSLAGASTPSVSQTATWNNAATTFTNILSNVTDTASAAASLLMDLQVGGAAKLNVTKTGYIGSAGAAALGSNTEVPALYRIDDTNTGIGLHGTDNVSIISGGVAMAWTGTTLYSVPGAQFGWGSNGNGPYNAGPDTGLARASAGVVRVTDGSTGIKSFLGGGTAVASAAALPLPTGNVFHVTGTTNITSITATNLQSGVVIILIFDGILTFTDGGNLKLAGNFVTTADDTITLAFDGTNFYETCRSVN